MYNLDNVTFGRQDGEVFRTIYKYGNGQIWWDIDARNHNVKARYYDGVDGSIVTLWDASILKDDLYTRTSRDISNMTLDAVYALPPDWSTTIPVFVNYNSALAPDQNTCTGFISKNYVRLFSVSGKNFRAVQGQTEGFVEC